jgi:hypothetical protein
MKLESFSPRDDGNPTDPGRRKFLRDVLGGVAGLAAGSILGVNEAEAFGVVSDEEFEHMVDDVHVPEEFGDESEVRREIKGYYKNLKGVGRRSMFITALTCNMGGKPYLTDYRPNEGIFEFICR